MMNSWYEIIPLISLSAVAIIAWLVGHFLVFRLLMKIAVRTRTKFDELFLKHCFAPSLWAIILLVYRWFLPLTATENYVEAVARFVSIAFTVTISWLLIKLTYILDDYVYDKFAIDTKDNLRARKIRTQLGVLKRIIIVIVLIVAIGTMLMSFEKVRQLGGAILASAGIIGIVVGIAAQKTIGTFIAGLQIAFSQPIRIDDVVIVENEWGRIEEITLTYVVIKIWDLRRLIVPITYFIEKPFQNWTRVTSDILGTVFLYVDYTVPVEEIRKHLHTILQNSKLWDGKVSVLQVTNTTEKTIEIRALMSAEDASTAWSLRCYVREKLIEFVRSNYPQSLPVFRAFIEKPSEID